MLGAMPAVLDLKRAIANPCHRLAPGRAYTARAVALEVCCVMRVLGH